MSRRDGGRRNDRSAVGGRRLDEEENEDENEDERVLYRAADRPGRAARGWGGGERVLIPSRKAS